jgi:hypothetical protein
VWNELVEQLGTLDGIVSGLSFTHSVPDLLEALRRQQLPADLIRTLVDAYQDGEFAGFRGAGGVSVEAAHRMNPHLEQGLLVFDAAAKAGLDPLAPQQRVLYGVRNPAIARSVLETLKQVRAILHEFKVRPGRIHVEVTRNLGLLPSQQKAVADARRERTAARTAARGILGELVPEHAITRAMVERYLLWSEQSGRCVYTGEAIALPALIDGAAVQIDHVMPLSRSSDHSRTNTVVCYAHANQEKGNCTPYEWQGSDAAWWNAMRRRVSGMPMSARKRRLILRVTAKNGVRYEGFVRGADISSLGIVLSDPLERATILRALVSSAARIEKFQVDRLGRRFPIEQEMRTWRGANAPWPAVGVYDPQIADRAEA